jgi:cytochrome P450 family 110
MIANRISRPRWLQKTDWIFNPVQFMEKYSAEYPDIFTADVVGFGDRIVFVNHPTGVQQILSEHKKFAALSDVNRIVEPFLGSQSLLLVEGAEHRRMRRLVMPPFHGERMKVYGELICELTQCVFSQLSPGDAFTARDIMQEISLQVILEVVFGLHSNDRAQQLKRLIPLFLDIFKSSVTTAFFFFPNLQSWKGTGSPWRRFLHYRQQVDNLIYEEIAERRAKPNPEATDILSILMAACDEDGKYLTDKELRDELMTLLFAGHETTATSLSWALYWIHRDLRVYHKLLDELSSLDLASNPVDIMRLSYLGAVIDETLRICPVATFTLPRVVREPVSVLGHSLEIGNATVGCIYLLHHRDDIYPNPKQFLPERFLSRQFSPYEYLPFGGGERRCLGEALAIYEMRLVLATILMNYQLELASKRPETLQRRGVIILGPKQGVKMKVIGREQKIKSKNQSDEQVYKVISN